MTHFLYRIYHAFARSLCYSSKLK